MLEKETTSDDFLANNRKLTELYWAMIDAKKGINNEPNAWRKYSDFEHALRVKKNDEEKKRPLSRRERSLLWQRNKVIRQSSLFRQEMSGKQWVYADEDIARDKELTDRYNTLLYAYYDEKRKIDERINPKFSQFGGKRILFNNVSLTNICGNWLLYYNDSACWDMPSGWGGPSFQGASYWLPRKRDIERITQVAQFASGSESPRIVEVGAGTGFLSFLMAQQGARVTGVDPDRELLVGHGNCNSEPPNLYIPPYSHANLDLKVGKSADLHKMFGRNNVDVVVSSWMPPALDLTEDIRRLNPKAVVYIRESFDIYEKNRPQYIERFDPKRGYRRSLLWSGPAASEVRGFYACVENYSDRYETYHKRKAFSIYNDSHVEIHVRNGIQIPDFEDNPDSKYHWETTDLTQVIESDILEKIQQDGRADYFQQGLNEMMDVKPMQRFR